MLWNLGFRVCVSASVRWVRSSRARVARGPTPTALTILRYSFGFLFCEAPRSSMMISDDARIFSLFRPEALGCPGRLDPPRPVGSLWCQARGPSPKLGRMYMVSSALASLGSFFADLFFRLVSPPRNALQHDPLANPQGIN